MDAFLPLLPQHLADQVWAGLQQRQRSYRGRFAPSPTGVMHRGNLRTALLSWLEARLHGGSWLLRIDDLDTPRNRPGSGEEIQRDLRWLGLAWDGPAIWQSQRRGIYRSVLSGLRRQGWLYACRCSRRMLAEISAPHGVGAVYPGTCRELGLGWGLEQGRCPSWRLRLPDGPLRWEERYGPPGELDGSQAVGDVVVRRADGFLAYHLVTAVDELILGISDVLRGADLWQATGPQVAVMARLGALPPRYGHLPLWVDSRGQRLSKREGAEGLAGYRAMGLDAPAVVGRLAASAGLVPAGSRLSAAELLQELSPAGFGACLSGGRDGGNPGLNT